MSISYKDQQRCKKLDSFFEKEEDKDGKRKKVISGKTK